MTSAETSKSPAGSDIFVFIALLILNLGMAWYAAPGRPQAPREVVIRSGVGEDLLAGLTRGRQGLIGSLYWAPLPTLIALPLLRLPPLTASGGADGAFILSAAIGAAFLGTLLNGWLRRTGARTGIRIVVTLALVLSPPFRLCVNQGSSELFFSFFGVGAVCFLLNWWETEHLRSLAYLALALMLAIVTRYQAILLFLGALAVVGLHLLLRRRGKKYTEATLTVFLVPPLYVAFLWVMTNRLLMGDAWFFLRGLAPSYGSWSHCLSALREGCPWRLFLGLAAIAALAWLVSRVATWRATLLSGLLLVAASFVFWRGPLAELTVPTSQADSELREKVIPYLNEDHSGDWIVVAGYRGYEIANLMPDRGRQRLHFTLSFYLDQVLESTRERRLYLLVPKPAGADLWEDIVLKYAGIFENGASFTVHEASWRYWRLWRVVRMDETDRR